jgi:mono/diheme cytochrome c family protein
MQNAETGMARMFRVTMVRAAGAAVALVAMSVIAPVALAADPEKGEELARRWCAACHVVASGQPTTRTEAPPFSTIARQPGFDAARVALFLLDPHPKMPDMGLSRRAAEDLAAYIAAQR